MEQTPRILSQTRSVCPVCLKEIDASLVRETTEIALIRTCPLHGRVRTAISRDAAEYEELLTYYREAYLRYKRAGKKKQYTIFFTNRCNLTCPICFMYANYEGNLPDPELARLTTLLATIRGVKVNIFGGEPTIRDDLAHLIASIKKNGNIAALFTNGIRVADREYLAALRDAGLDELHLQFDGFDCATEMRFRGMDVSAQKYQTLENARTLGIPVVLEFTLEKGLNSEQIDKAFALALRHTFIKGLCFRSYCALGRRGVPIEKLTTDELLLETQRALQGRLNRQHLITFQKLAYIMADLFSFDWCHSHRFMVICRGSKNDYHTIGELLRFDSIRRPLAWYPRIRKRGKLAGICFLALAVLPRMLTLRTIALAVELCGVLLYAKYQKALTQSLFGRRFFIIDFESPCDRMTFDLHKVCNTAVIFEDLTVYPSFFKASLEKERFYESRASR